MSPAVRHFARHDVEMLAVPMIAWMRHRGHCWTPCAERAVAA